MPSIFVALLVLLAAPALIALPVPASQRVEIDALMVALQTSACEFQRNNLWHNAADAKSHLLRKLGYLEGKNVVQSTEQFIELAASKSSVSGRAYQVKCAGAAPVDSNIWLNTQLKIIRSTARPVALSTK